MDAGVNGGQPRVTDQGHSSHDVLDRPTKQEESHVYAGIDPNAAPQRTTTFDYLALTNGISQEVVSGQSASAGTKSYRYDALGARTTLQFTPGTGASEPAGRFSYSYDLHGNVALLLQDTNSPKATYGYQPYGAEARDPLRASNSADHFGDPSQSCRDLIRGDINLHDRPTSSAPAVRRWVSAGGARPRAARLPRSRDDSRRRGQGCASAGSAATRRWPTSRRRTRRRCR